MKKNVTKFNATEQHTRIHSLQTVCNRCNEKSVQLKTNSQLNKWPAIFHGKKKKKKRCIQITPEARKLGANATNDSVGMSCTSI